VIRFKGRFQCSGSTNHYPLCRPSYALGLDACFVQHQAKTKQSLPSQAFCSLNEDISDSFVRFVCPNVCRFLCTHLTPLWGATEVSGQ
jgi:hypothetical protein